MRTTRGCIFLHFLTLNRLNPMHRVPQDACLLPHDGSRGRSCAAGHLGPSLPGWAFPNIGFPNFGKPPRSALPDGIAADPLCTQTQGCRFQVSDPCSHAGNGDLSRGPRISVHDMRDPRPFASSGCPDLAWDLQTLDLKRPSTMCFTLCFALTLQLS